MSGAIFIGLLSGIRSTVKIASHYTRANAAKLQISMIVPLQKRGFARLVSNNLRRARRLLHFGVGQRWNSRGLARPVSLSCSAGGANQRAMDAGNVNA